MIDRTPGEHEAESFEIPNAMTGERLDRTVSMLYGITRERSGNLIDQGAVSINGQAVSKRSYRVLPSQTLSANIEAIPDRVPVVETNPTPLDIVYFDDEVLVIDKRAGQVVHPGSGNATGTISQGLLALFPEVNGVGEEGRSGVVHRLDKGTSGLMLLARTEMAHTSLSRQIANREVGRTYIALVRGLVEFNSGVIDAPISRSTKDPVKMAIASAGRAAVTNFTVLERIVSEESFTLLELRLETGRTHQIRVHLEAIGHSVVGDTAYRGKRFEGLGRPFLHSSKLSFQHPSDGRTLTFSSGLAKDLRSVLRQLGAAYDGQAIRPD